MLTSRPSTIMPAGAQRIFTDVSGSMRHHRGRDGFHERMESLHNCKELASQILAQVVCSSVYYCYKSGFDKGKPGESRGRKANGSTVAPPSDYDRQAAEDHLHRIAMPRGEPGRFPRLFAFSLRGP